MDVKIDYSKMFGHESALSEFKNAINGLRWNGGWRVHSPQELFRVLQDLQGALEDQLELSSGRAYCSVVNEVCFRMRHDEEDRLRERLNDLAKRWREGLKENQELFNFDGFYPNYTKQRVKILFVGREACYMSGRNYCDVIGDGLAKNVIGDKIKWTVAQYPFHRRQFYIAYGILMAACSGGMFPEWNDVPNVCELTKIFGRGGGGGSKEMAEGISWAFINLSKLSNNTGDWRTDDARYRPFVSDKKNREHLQEQIKILAPDVIIGSNVYDLVEIMGYDRNADVQNKNCYFYKEKEGEEPLPPFLNCYHFSAVKSDQTCFYEAIRDVVSRHLETLDIKR